MHEVELKLCLALKSIFGRVISICQRKAALGTGQVPCHILTCCPPMLEKLDSSISDITTAIWEAKKYIKKSTQLNSITVKNKIYLFIYLFIKEGKQRKELAIEQLITEVWIACNNLWNEAKDFRRVYGLQSFPCSFIQRKRKHLVTLKTNADLYKPCRSACMKCFTSVGDLSWNETDGERYLAQSKRVFISIQTVQYILFFNLCNL